MNIIYGKKKSEKLLIIKEKFRMNKNSIKYLKDVKSLLPVFQKEEKLFFERFKQTIEKETNQSTMTYQDCIEKFGEPKDVIINYYDEMDSEKLLKRIRNQYLIKRIIYILIFSIMFVSFVACGLLYKSYLEVKEIHVTESETIIETIE